MKFDYDEISPITKNKCVLVEMIGSELTQKICMESGYNTTTYNQEQNENFELMETNMPDILVDKKVVDDLGYHWYLSILNTPNGCLTPIPDSETESGYKWMVCGYVNTLEVDDEGKAIRRLDVENAEYFLPNEFPDAIDHLTNLINTERNVEEG